MIKNNIEVDVKVKCIEHGLTQAQLAEAIGTTGQYVNRIIKKQDGVVNKTFVQMLEVLGYDIELTYVKREGQSAFLFFRFWGRVEVHKWCQKLQTSIF